MGAGFGEAMRRVAAAKRKKILDEIYAGAGTYTPPIRKDLDEAEVGDNKTEYLESASSISIVDLISEGPIEGFCDENGETLNFFWTSNRETNTSFLQSVLLDETKVYNPDSDTFNFKVFDLDFREGQEVQEPLGEDYSYAAQTSEKNIRLIPSNTTDPSVRSHLTTAEGDFKRGREKLADWEGAKTQRDVHQEFKKAERNCFPITHTIVNPLVEIVSVNLQINVLSRLKVGKRSSQTVPEEVTFLIFVGNESGQGWDSAGKMPKPPIYQVTEPAPSDIGYHAGDLVKNDTGGYFVKCCKGLATSDYIFENIIHLPPNPNNSNRVIRVMRLESDAGYGTEEPQIECSFHSVTEAIPAALSYPNCALVATKLDARTFPTIPTRKYDLKLLKVKVPSNYLPDTKEYAGNWNGRFKTLASKVDPKQEFDIIQRTKATVENKTGADDVGTAHQEGDGSSNVKVDNDNKKSGSGSLFFAESTSMKTTADYAKRISVKRPKDRFPIENDIWPKSNLRVGDFGFENFTIEFYVKTTAAEIQKIHKADGSGTCSTSGLEGFYKTILSSGEGTPPCTGWNRSDSSFTGAAAGMHPMVFERTDAVGEQFLKVVGRKPSGEVQSWEVTPTTGNWFVQIGTNNGKDLGQIFFRYFTGHGHWKRKMVKKVDTTGSGAGIDGVLFGKGAPGQGTGSYDIKDKTYGWQIHREYRSDAEHKDHGSSPVDELVRVKSASNIADGEWHHVAITRNADTFNVYIDGVDETDTSIIRPDTAEYPKDLRGKAYNFYNGEVNGFAFRSGKDAGSGLINIGNDRCIGKTPAGTSGWDQREAHTSFSGYLDNVHVIRKCKYTASFDSKSWPHGGTGTSPTAMTDMIDNEVQSLFLLNGDGLEQNSVAIEDHNPGLVTAAELFDHGANFDGAWNQWTDNPAWIFYDLVTNKRYGLGKYGISSDFVNKWNLYELGKYCDGLVPTGFQPKYGSRTFEVVSLNKVFIGQFPTTVTAGEIFIEISGFANQAEFLKEFPEGNLIAIHDLNDGKEPVHRRIKYIKMASATSSALQEKIATAQGERYLSYNVSAGPDSPGSAIIHLQRPISVEECYLLDPTLKTEIIRKRVSPRKDGEKSSAIYFKPKTAKQLIVEKMRHKDTPSTYPVNAAFDIAFESEDKTQKINDTSISGSVSAEFPGEFDVLEPRFTCNLHLTTAVDAFKILNDLASTFRGLTYIVGGKVFTSFDKQRDPIMNFTNSNVKDGLFRYTGSPKTSRFTTAMVRYVDKHENFRPKVEYVEDPEGIVRYGLIEKELVAFGCSSRGQARRLGQWFLFSSQLETESVKFTAGKEAAYLRPGDVVKIIDKNKTKRRYGGRIVDFNGTNKQVTLDNEVDKSVVGEKITIAIPRAFETEESLDRKVSKKKGITDEELAAQRKPQIKEYKVSAIDKDANIPAGRTILTLTALDGDPAEELGSIKVGAVWILQNSDTDLKIQEVLYRVMSVSEESPMEYGVLCLEYNDSKFDATEKNLKIDKMRYAAISNPDRPDKVEGVTAIVTNTGVDGEGKMLNLSVKSADLAQGDKFIVDVQVQRNNNGILLPPETFHFEHEAIGNNGENVKDFSVNLGEGFEGVINTVGVVVVNPNDEYDDGLPIVNKGHGQ